MAQFLNQAQVNKRSAYNYYPVQSFGRLAEKNDQIVTKHALPYLAEQLKQSVKAEDSHRIQVFIRALGNLGHEKVLQVFEPYLEGQIPVTNFQRLALVVALDKLVQNHPRQARQVLYQIYQNVGEAHEIRCAAVFQLMRTGPPTAMLQRMAEFTNQDPSNQVRSAVQSAIRSAAKLRHPDHQELAANARAAVDMLNQEEAARPFSRSTLRDYVVDELDLAYKQQWSYIGSQDEFWPQALFVGTQKDMGGLKRNTEFYAMVSSIDDLTDILDDQFDGSKVNSNPKNPRNGRKHLQTEPRNNKWSTEKIAQMLNIQPDDAEQLEGQILLNVMNGKRFFAFDNQTLERIPQAVQHAAENLRNGQNFNFIKLYNQDAVTISFPLASGFPFVYTYKTPTLVKLQGEAKLKTNPDLAQPQQQQQHQVQIPKTANLSAELEIVYGTAVQAKIGFMTVHNHQRYSAGYTQKAQIYLPIQIQVNLDMKNNEMVTEIAPRKQNAQVNVFQASQWPYTARQDVLALRPVAESKEAKLIHVRPASQIEQTIGDHSTGMVFHLQVKHEQTPNSFVNYIKNLQRHDLTSAALFPWSTTPDEYFNVNVQYDGQQSTTRAARITVNYSDNKEDMGPEPNKQPHPHQTEQQQQQQHQENIAMIANPSSKQANSQSRQQQFLRQASQGITHPQAAVLDVAVQFDGAQQQAEYIATIAVAKSPVDQRSHLLLFAQAQPLKQQQTQICLAATAKYPNTPQMNLKNALQFDSTSGIDMDLQYGEKCQQGRRANLKVKMQQSQEFQDKVRNHPVTKQCLKQMDQGNQQLPACQKAVIYANTNDQLNAQIEYDQLPQKAQYWAYQAYTMARQAMNLHVQEDTTQKGKDGKVQIEARLAKSLKAVNVQIQTSGMQIEAKAVPLRGLLSQAALAVHPAMNMMDRIQQKALQQHNICVIDQNLLNTFDNNTIDHNFGKCWHVAVHTVPREQQNSESASNEPNQDQQLTVLVSV